jgi:hypothetical protein
MPANPLRRRSRLGDAAKLATADAALSYAKDRFTPGSRKRGRGKALLLGGALVAVGVAAMANRNKVAGLIGARSSVPEPPLPVPPAPSNYDAPGPPANTATPVPAPDPVAPAAIDERAEEEAAAAEAAAIGGEVSDYASSDPALAADEAERPVAEAGGGEAEGQEQTEAQLEENLAPPEAGAETPELENHPAAGQAELLGEPEGKPEDEGGGGWQTWSGISSRQ